MNVVVSMPLACNEPVSPQIQIIKFAESVADLVATLLMILSTANHGASDIVSQVPEDSGSHDHFFFSVKPSTPCPHAPAFFPHFIIPHAWTQLNFGGGS